MGLTSAREVWEVAEEERLGAAALAGEAPDGEAEPATGDTPPAA